MITIISGVPGAGKTLYTIEKLLMPLVGQSITYKDKHGDEITAPRTIYTNINGLLIDHELIDGGDNQGLRDWHKWAKPGSIICFDEYQRVWAPRANGSKVPEDIAALDTHRHMGVDFILITQSVMNTDRHIHALGGRHLHVRRVGNMKLAIVYEWDHVSKSLMYSKAITKSPWKYNKKVFKKYQSAEAHTKQPRQIPGLVWFVIIGLIAGAVLTPWVYTRISERINPTKVAHQVKPNPQPITAHQVAPPAPAVPPVAPDSLVAASTEAAAGELGQDGQPKPHYVGCAAAKGVCKCYDSQAHVVEKEPEFCTEVTATPKVVLGWADEADSFINRASTDRDADLAMLARMAPKNAHSDDWNRFVNAAHSVAR